MRLLLFLIAVVAILFGFVMLSVAKSAIHEIEAFILLLIGAVTFSGAGIIDSIYLLLKQVKDSSIPSTASDE